MSGPCDNSLSPGQLALRIALDNPACRAITCDVFDTLIFRQSGTPEQFWCACATDKNWQGILGDDDPCAFSTRRRSAEETARQKRWKEAGSREVMLADIYACWPSTQGSQLCQLEMAQEYATWRVNDALVEILQRQLTGRPLILISDMYLPSALIRRFLEQKMPALAISAIYVSGECGTSKQSGLLFRHVLAEHGLDPAAVLHIGDDPVTDIQMAQATGINCAPVPLGDAYLAQLKYEQRLSSCAIPGLEVLRREWAWHADGSPFSLLAGHVYAPILYAFARWIVERCRQQGIRTLYCLLREGGVIANLVQLIPGHELQVRTLSVSRRSSYLPSSGTWHTDRLAQLIQRRGYTLQELFEDLGVEEPVRWQAHAITPLTELAASEEWPAIVAWLVTRQQAIDDHLCRQRGHLLQYLREQGVSNRRDIALLDWGCGGSLLHNLCVVGGLNDVRCFMFYSSSKAERVALQQPLQVFQPAQTRQWGHVLAAYPEVSEILLNGTLPSTRAYQEVDGQVVPVPATTVAMTPQQYQAQEGFIRAILMWAKLASRRDWLGDGVTLEMRHHLIAILYRLIQYPTWDEAKTLAVLPVPLCAGASRPLLTAEAAEQLKSALQDGEQAYRLGLEGGSPLLKLGFWYPGLVALAFPGQLQVAGELVCYQDDDMVGPLLLQALRQRNITRTALYGAGELGMRVYTLLRAHGITITHVIDRRAESTRFQLGDHEVISLEQAAKLGVTSYTVASRAFATEIFLTIQAKYQKTGTDVEIVLYR